MTNALLVLGLLWLLGLTAVVAALVRHMGTIQAAASTGSGAPPEVGFNFDTDGPWIPSELPQQAETVFRDAGVTRSTFVGVFFSAGCGNCLERAEAIISNGVDPLSTVFLITGNRVKAVEDVLRILRPSGAQIITDPGAHDVVKSLDIGSTPFAFKVTDGTVTGKTYIRSAADFFDLVAQTAEPAAPARVLTDERGSA